MKKEISKNKLDIGYYDIILGELITTTTRKVKEMSINLEEDKIDSLANANTNDIKELSNQVIKLRDLEDEFDFQRKKELKIKK